MSADSAKPAASVILSVFNNQRELPAAMESIFGQSFSDFEVIAVDDGSSDGSGEILERYAHGDPRLRVVHQSNQGLSSSLNLACDMARADYLIRHDADDVSARDRFARQLFYMQSRPEVALAGAWTCFVHPQDGPRFVFALPDSHELLLSYLTRGHNPLVHGAAILRASAFKKLPGGYRFHCPGEEYDLWLRMSQHGLIGMVTSVCYFFTLSQYGITYSSYRMHSKVINLALSLHKERMHYGRELTPDIQEKHREIVRAFSPRCPPGLVADYGEGIASLRVADYRRYRLCMKKAARGVNLLSLKARLHVLFSFLPGLARFAYKLREWNTPRRYYFPCPADLKLPVFPEGPDDIPGKNLR